MFFSGSELNALKFFYCDSYKCNRNRPLMVDDKKRTFEIQTTVDPTWLTVSLVAVFHVSIVVFYCSWRSGHSNAAIAKQVTFVSLTRKYTSSESLSVVPGKGC